MYFTVNKNHLKQIENLQYDIFSKTYELLEYFMAHGKHKISFSD